MIVRPLLIDNGIPFPHLRPATTFEASLGQFAKPHFDRHDAGAALTAMTQLLSVPKGYDPGVFANHDFKIFIKTTEIFTAFFTGLHRHGASPPSPPPGQPLDSSAYRLTVICYPNGKTIGGESRNSLVSFSYSDDANSEDNGRDVLMLSPEVRFRKR